MHPHWKNRLLFIIASIGAAVGVGNIWRFPYMVGENGGGTYIATYAALFFLIGVPLLFLEFLVGRRHPDNLVTSFEKLSKQYAWVAYVPLVFSVLVMAYYVVITGWTLFYFVSALQGQFTPFGEMVSGTYNSLFYAFIVCALLYLVTRMKFNEGLETVTKLLVPCFFISVGALVAYASTLPGFGKALSFLTSVGMPSMPLVLAAISQMFFSLSIGWGIMFVYSSYEKAKNGLVASTIAVGLADLLASVLSSILVFAIVFTFGLEPASGTTLSFVSLPLVFQSLPFGYVLMAVFFLVMFTAAFTSALSTTQIFVGVLTERYKKTRPQASLMVVLAFALLSIPAALSFSPLSLSFLNMRIFELLDTIVAGKLFPIFTVSYVLVLAWKHKTLKSDLKKEFGRLAPFASFWIKYVIPLVVLAVGLWQFV